LTDEPDEGFADLMARAYRDDRRAIATLMALYEPEIRRAARTMLGQSLRSSLDPTDLVQSVHLRLLLALKQKRLAITSPQHLRSLAMTLLRHKLIEHWRRQRPRDRHGASPTMAGGLTPERLAVPLREFDPATTAEYNDLVAHFFRSLRTDDRRLLAMRIQGYRTREIAAELGIDPASVRMRLSRIRRRLRDEASPSQRGGRPLALNPYRDGCERAPTAPRLDSCYGINDSRVY
jgi:RNA polymerase sigma-70 factor (ECF subfamily)